MSESKIKLMFIGQNVTYLQDSMQPIFYAARRCGIELYWAANFSNYRGDLNEIPCKTLQVDFSRHPLLSMQNIAAIGELRKHIRDYGINAIHCNTPLGSTCGRIAAWLEHVNKVLYTAHGLLYFDGAPNYYVVFKWVEWALAHITDGVICMNREDERAIRKLPLRGDSVWKINGVGVNLEKRGGLCRSVKREELDLRADQVVILCVGRLEKVKDLPTTIRAFANAADKNWVLLICGEGYERGTLEKIVEDCDIKDRVRFLGFRDDVREIMHASDIYVMSSLHEGLPRSLVEAMNAGLACIVSDARGCVDLIRDGENGIVCRRGDVEAFKKALTFVVKNADIRTAYAKQAKADSKQYDLDSARKAHEEIYRSMFLSRS